VNESKIVPHRITKPIQLLAAWLAGLAVVNGSFLAGAATIHAPAWIPAVLVIAAVLNVPLFLASLFLLQTRFRPEMQEDSYYSKYLERTYSDRGPQGGSGMAEKPLEELAQKIVAEVTKGPAGQDARQEKVVELLKESEIEHLAERYAASRTLSELHMFPNLWKEITSTWSRNPEFREDLAALREGGLVEFPSDDVDKARLTGVGQAVATRLEKGGKLWNQTHERRFPKERVKQ